MRPFTQERLGELLADSPSNTFWRHDVDVSTLAALEMATLEADLGIDATFYVMTTSPFYTAAEAAVLAMHLSSLGHRVGWHLDRDQIVARESLRGLAVSFHCPTDLVLWRDLDHCESAYAAKWEGRYISDSRGRFDLDPEDAFALQPADGSEPSPIQVNLHPEWWFEPDWADQVPDDVYERFFYESKQLLHAELTH